LAFGPSKRRIGNWNDFEWVNIRVWNPVFTGTTVCILSYLLSVAGEPNQQVYADLGNAEVWYRMTRAKPELARRQNSLLAKVIQLIPSLPTISVQSAPGAAKTTSNAPLQVLTASHTSAGPTTRSLPTQNDSSVPSNALFSSGERSTGTG
jgi:hypothetical protein